MPSRWIHRARRGPGSGGDPRRGAGAGREETRRHARAGPCGAPPTERSRRTSAAPRRGRRDGGLRLRGARDPRERELELSAQPFERVGLFEGKTPARLLAKREQRIDDLPGPREIHLAASCRRVGETLHVERRRLREHVEEAKERRARGRGHPGGGGVGGGGCGLGRRIGRCEFRLRFRAYLASSREKAAVHDLDRFLAFGHKSPRVSVFYVNAGRLRAWKIRMPPGLSSRSWKGSETSARGTGNRRPATSPGIFSRSATRFSMLFPARTGGSWRASWAISSFQIVFSRSSGKSAAP